MTETKPLDPHYVDDKVAEMLERHGSIEDRVGVGHPDNPYAGQLLSEDEERRIDDRGEPIVNQAAWRDVPTGTYVCVYVTRHRLPMHDLEGIVYGHKETNIRGWHLNVTATAGKPVLKVNYAGAALELPSDLGNDDLKQRYVAEWIVSTAAEALAMTLQERPNEDAWTGIAEWLAESAEEAIGKVGL